MLTSALLVSFLFFQVQSQDTCKKPYVEQRLLADDVRYASPFYVIAMPKTPQTVEMDNVCYTYFENNNGGFFHVMSVTYKNGSNTYYDFTKGDISNRMGIAEATSSDCVYHDYTLKPICNVTVFNLYRCFVQGQCSSNSIDIGVTPGVDVRVTLAASPKVSSECQLETAASLRDTSVLAGGDYILLPQKLTPNCITKYDGLVSIGESRALGPKTVSNDLNDRIADIPSPTPSQPSKPSPSQQSSFFKNGIPPPSAFNPYGYSSGPSAPYPKGGNTPTGSGQTYASSGSYSFSSSKYPGGGGYSTIQSSPGPEQGPTNMWSNMPGSPAQWNGQTVQPGAETHYHIWQSATSAAALKAISSKNSNVHYHIHSWAPPQGCCKCA